MDKLTEDRMFFKATLGDRSFSYYEYKYFVPHELLSTVLQVLEEFYGASDPYSAGIVDSIYYDTLDQTCLAQCVDGDSQKVKFRIRGYGGGRYLQIHQKFKDLSGVSKLKSKIVEVVKQRGAAPHWDDLAPKYASDHPFRLIHYNAECLGPLFPSIQVKYQRYRYRTYDFRMTLDSNIEVSSLANGLPHRLTNTMLPFHVLELKTVQTRPKLPFIGLVKLRQVSFSKFMLGIQHLDQV